MTVPKVTLLQAAALEKAAKHLKEKLSEEESITPGGHAIDFDCRVSGVLTKTEDVQFHAPFKAEPALRALLLAAVTRNGNPARAVEKAIAEARQLKVNPQELHLFEAAVDKYLDDSKAEFQKKSAKSKRSGNVSFAGTIERL